MKIYGLQKMTLLDYPGRIACTVFLSGCDMRCPWCHNSELAEGKAPAVMTSEELISFLKKRQGMLEGVAVTGGEPLLREESLELLREIRALGYPVKLDSNGTHPDRLRRAAEEGLIQYCAMDIKNSPERYAETAGLSEIALTAVRESVDFLKTGSIDYEFRTTAVKELHDEQSFRAIAEWISGAKRYAIQKFTDRDTVPFEGFHAPEEAQIQAWAEIVRPHVRELLIRG
ncbi:MAG: anaerobic ribonucleoside-triphosphate reductase activating protein [Clostridia bacterium]|nr:anaerobic ribonucleoside-triphosphate reductase activating protein [Clostridia bacterium]